MDTVSFDKLLLKTAFCCMASDGQVDTREVAKIRSLCEASELFQEFDFQGEINKLVTRINEGGKAFIQYYLDLLERSSLTREEELNVLDFAIQTIHADEEVEYSEVKFFKTIRHRLAVSDDEILARFPELDDMFLEQDIDSGSLLDRITSKYLEGASLPQFAMITLDADPSEN